MNKELATVLRGKLTGLPFLDLVGGLVQTITQDQSVDNGPDNPPGKTTHRYPVATDTSADTTCVGKPFPMMPADVYKSVIYFEDFGSGAGPRRHNLVSYTSRLRLIVWLNRGKLVSDPLAEISGKVMASIIDRLVTRNPQNTGIFTRLVVNVSGIPTRDAGLFSRYTYTEQDRQYLMPPFEFFGIDLTCNYFVNPNCLEAITWTDGTCY